MSDRNWIIGTIITATVMLGGMQFTLWSFTDAAIRKSRAAIANVRTDVSELAQRVDSIEGSLEGRAGRRGGLEDPAASSPAAEARSSPDDTVGPVGATAPRSAPGRPDSLSRPA